MPPISCCPHVERLPPPPPPPQHCSLDQQTRIGEILKEHLGSNVVLEADCSDSIPLMKELLNKVLVKAKVATSTDLSSSVLHDDDEDEEGMMEIRRQVSQQSFLSVTPTLGETSPSRKSKWSVKTSSGASEGPPKVLRMSTAPSKRLSTRSTMLFRKSKDASRKTKSTSSSTSKPPAGRGKIVIAANLKEQVCFVFLPQRVVPRVVNSQTHSDRRHLADLPQVGSPESIPLRRNI